MNVSRLLGLANYLENIPPERFNMAYWGERTECGTVCCALGHATEIPEFAAGGLWMQWHNDGGPSLGYVVYSWHGVRCVGLAAAARFFEIRRDQAEELFDCESYDGATTPTIVATRIREFVAKEDARAPKTETIFTTTERAG